MLNEVFVVGFLADFFLTPHDLWTIWFFLCFKNLNPNSSGSLFLELNSKNYKIFVRLIFFNTLISYTIYIPNRIYNIETKKNICFYFYFCIYSNTAILCNLTYHVMTHDKIVRKEKNGCNTFFLYLFWVPF